MFIDNKHFLFFCRKYKYSTIQQVLFINSHVINWLAICILEILRYAGTFRSYINCLSKLLHWCRQQIVKNTNTRIPKMHIATFRKESGPICFSNVWRTATCLKYKCERTVHKANCIVHKNKTYCLQWTNFPIWAKCLSSIQISWSIRRPQSSCPTDIELAYGAIGLLQVQKRISLNNNKNLVSQIKMRMHCCGE